MYFCAATELPQHRRQYQKLPTRIIGANSIVSTNHYKRSSFIRYIFKNQPDVMIAPSEPSISLRSWLANNSKGRSGWSFFRSAETCKTKLAPLTSPCLLSTNKHRSLNKNTVYDQMAGCSQLCTKRQS